MGLVCPECGSDNVGTREQAEIWQRATFTYTEDVGSFSDVSGKEVEAEWEAYDSEDVGDTETVGFFCRGCQSTWDGREMPFITEEEYDKEVA